MYANNDKVCGDETNCAIVQAIEFNFEDFATRKARSSNFNLGR